MRIAIPIWEGRVSPLLDTAGRLRVMNSDHPSSSWAVHLIDPEIIRRSGRIRQEGIEVLICGAVSRPFQGMLSGSGIKVISGISGTVDAVFSAYLNGELFQPRFLMPGVSIDRAGFS
jgi:predicted Fe-Mo cluster-binding NifX family protein